MQRVPKYRHHKARNVAVVTIDGKDHFLGTYNSTESHQRYHRLLLDKLQAPPTPVTYNRDESRIQSVVQVHTILSINELITVRTHGVVLHSPAFDEHPGFQQRIEDLTVQ